MRYCSYNLGLRVLVMLGNFAKLNSPRRLVQFWQNFQASLVLLIPNYTHNRMITYTNFYLRRFQSKYLVTLYEHVLWLLTLLNNQWRSQPDNFVLLRKFQSIIIIPFFRN